MKFHLPLTFKSSFDEIRVFPFIQTLVLENMGQILSVSELLPVQVQAQYGVLTGCKLHLGTLTEIRRFYERFRRICTGSGYYVSAALFANIARNSPVDSLDAHKAFERGAGRVINILECVSALVVYAAAARDNKVLFLMRLFDFDNNRCLSRDEVTIMCTAVLNGVAAVTGTRRTLSGQVERVSEVMFREADTNPDSLITYEEYALP